MMRPTAVLLMLAICLSPTVLLAQDDRGEPSAAQLHQVDDVHDAARNPGAPAVHEPAAAARPESRADYMELLEHYAPHIVQEVECTNFGDKITRYDYDGDQGADNNWDNLGVNCGNDPSCDVAAPGCAQARPLPAYVYAAVIETSTEYDLSYCLFHPADDFYCDRIFYTDNHENDLEGIILMVRKDETPFGHLRMMQVQAHSDFFAYAAPGQGGITGDPNGDKWKDWEYETFWIWDESHPIVYVEGGGHGIRYDVTEFLGGSTPSDWWVHYRHTGVAEDPPEWKYTHQIYPDQLPENMFASYDIILLRCAIWQRRNFSCSSMCMFEGNVDVHMERYDILDVGAEFGHDQCDGAAHPPWRWKDNDDDDPGERYTGEWFLDPAWYHEWQFNWDPPISTAYEYNPFVRNHLCGEIYDILGDFETPDYGRYVVTCDLEVPADKSLWVGNDVDILFPVSGYSFTAHGPTTIIGYPQPVTMTRDILATMGMKIYGQAVFKNGGGIGFPN